MRKGIIVSGYFNPLHKGHLELFEKSKQAGDFLIVVVNSDLQRELKGSKEFMTEDERLRIIQHIREVDYSCISIDKDKTQIQTLKMLNHKFGDIMELYFANGGDQNNTTIPEANICGQLGIKLIDGLGEKIQSSSWLLAKK